MYLAKKSLKNKKSLKDVVEKTGRIPILTFDNFAYYDEKCKRWRAGKYNKTRKTGSFVSAKDAQRIRASGSTSVYASRMAVRIAMQKDVSNKEAVKLAYAWVREYRKTRDNFKRMGIPNYTVRAVEYVDEQFNLEES
jgi:hypothetical protein